MMKHAPRRLLLPMVLACTALAVAPLPTAVAQDERPKAPVPSKTGEPPRVRNMLLLVVLMGIGLGVQAIPSKRGHQD